MKEKDKELLFKDICARLPYVLYFKMEVDGKSTNKILTTEWISDIKYHPQYYKAYLRPLSSMTEEECKEYYVLCHSEEDSYGHVYYYDTMESIDWLNAHHFDYRGLIEKGLALEAPEGMYK